MGQSGLSSEKNKKARWIEHFRVQRLQKHAIEIGQLELAVQTIPIAGETKMFRFVFIVMTLVPFTTTRTELNAQDAAREIGDPSLAVGRTQPTSKPVADSSLITKHVWAVVGQDGKLDRGHGVVSVKRVLVGGYEVTFDADIAKGVFIACAGSPDSSPAPRGLASVAHSATTKNCVWVDTMNWQGDYVDLPFHIAVTYR
jgi:hypothetical protein